jgi:hypothetical protein
LTHAGGGPRTYDGAMAANREAAAQTLRAVRKLAIRAFLALMLVFVATTAVGVARQLVLPDGSPAIPAVFVAVVLIVGTVGVALWYVNDDAWLAYQVLRERQHRTAALWEDLGGKASASRHPATWGSIDEIEVSADARDEATRLEVARLALGVKRPDVARRIVASIPEGNDAAVELARALINARLDPERAEPAERLRSLASTIEPAGERRYSLESVAVLEAEWAAASGRDPVKALADGCRKARRESRLSTAGSSRQLP